MALTELTIKNLKPKVKSYKATDGGGLVLTVFPNGSKLWRYRYRFQGAPNTLSLGKYPATSLSEARKGRDEARAVLDSGKDPSREKKAHKLRKTYDHCNTFERIARDCLALRQSNMNEKYRTQCIARMEQHVFPLIGALPITEITIPDVVRVVEKIGARGTVETAKRMKQLISQTFRYASQRGLCTHNPAADLRDILPPKVEKHHASVHPSEAHKLLQAIDTLSNGNLSKAAMQLLCLTLVRTGELIGAKWNEIDWAKEEWHIPKERMKMKRPHIVPLSTQALAILRELQKRTGDKDFIFFSAASKSSHVSNGIVLMALRRLGYKGIMTGHGFRSLASTILNEKKYNADVIERQLAHEDADKVRAAYNRAEYLLERKKMMQDYADMIDEAIKGQPDRVIAMPQPKLASS